MAGSTSLPLQAGGAFTKAVQTQGSAMVAGNSSRRLQAADPCAKYGGLSHQDGRTCCASNCGAFCGKGNCCSGPGGCAACCGSSIPDDYTCSGTQRAPCTMQAWAVSVSGISTIEGVTANGAHIWKDRTYVFSGLPSFMVGAQLFKGPVKDIPQGTVISIDVTAPATIYVSFENFYHSSSSRDGGFPSSLPGAGFSNTGAAWTWDSSGNMPVWSKSVEAGTTTLPATTGRQTVMSISVQQATTTTSTTTTTTQAPHAFGSFAEARSACGGFVAGYDRNAMTLPTGSRVYGGKWSNAARNNGWFWDSRLGQGWTNYQSNAPTQANCEQFCADMYGCGFYRSYRDPPNPNAWDQCVYYPTDYCTVQATTTTTTASGTTTTDTSTTSVTTSTTTVTVTTVTTSATTITKTTTTTTTSITETTAVITTGRSITIDWFSDAACTTTATSIYSHKSILRKTPGSKCVETEYFRPGETGSGFTYMQIDSSGKLNMYKEPDCSGIAVYTYDPQLLMEIRCPPRTCVGDPHIPGTYKKISGTGFDPDTDLSVNCGAAANR